MNLDRKDLNILNLLQEDCTISLQSLSKEVGLTQTPCYERIKKMQKSGVIVRYSAIVSSDLLGFKHHAVLRVQASDQSSLKDLALFESFVVENKAVVKVLKISSKFNYVINYRYKEIDEFFKFVGTINKQTIVCDSEIVMVLKTLKDEKGLFF